MSYVIIWTYDVAPEHAEAFCAAYGPDGDWAKLFSQADGFVGVDLYSDGQRYLTVDRWDSREAFERFQTRFGRDYSALDAKLAHLSLGQVRVGAFTAVP